MTELEALGWCRAHRARISFYEDNVHVFAEGHTRRRPTFVEAVKALKTKVDP